MRWKGEGEEGSVVDSEIRPGQDDLGRKGVDPWTWGRVSRSVCVCTEYVDIMTCHVL